MKSIKSLIPFYVIIALVFTSCSDGCKGKKDQLFDLIPVKTKKDATKISLMDYEGKLVVEDEFDVNSKIYPTNGVITEITKEGKAKYWKLEDKKIKSLFKEEKIFESGTPFNEEYAVVTDKEGALSLIDKTGNAVIPNLSKIKEYDVILVGVMSDGLIRFKTDEGKWGYVDKSGQVVIKPMYTKCENFVNGAARVINEKSEFLIIDKTGAQVFKGREDTYYYPLKDERLVFATPNKDKWYIGLTDLKGNKIIKDNKYKNSSLVINDGILAVQNEEDMYGVITAKDGEPLGDLRFKFDNVPYIAKSGNFIATLDKKLKLYNRKGELVIGLDDYNAVVPVSSNKFLAFSDKDKNNSRIEIIDEKGKVVGKETYYSVFSSTDYIIEMAQSPEIAMNQFTLASTYFNFDKLFSSTFSSISTTQIGGASLSSNIQSVLTKFPHVDAQSNNTSIYRGDDYTYAFYFDSGKTTSTETPTAATATPSYQGANDQYPYLDSYSYSYKTYRGDRQFKYTFDFDAYIKTYSYDELNQLIYELNPTAHVSAVNVDFGELAGNKILVKKLRQKLIASGWKTNEGEDATSLTFINAENSNSIYLSTSSLKFSFYYAPAFIEPSY